MMRWIIVALVAASAAWAICQDARQKIKYDVNEEWPGRYDEATESWEFPPETRIDIRPTPPEMGKP